MWAPPGAALFGVARDFGGGHDGRPAAQARATGPSDDVVPFAPAAVAGSGLEHARDGDGCLEGPRCPVGKPPGVDVAGGCPRVEALEVTDLVGPHVAQPCNDALIQESVDHPLSGSGVQAGDGFVGVPIRAERVGPEMADESGLNSCRDEVHDGHLDTPDGGAGVDDESDPHVGQDPAGKRPTLGADRPGSLHSEMGVQGEAVVEPGEEVLAVGVVLDHPPSGDGGASSRPRPDLPIKEGMPVQGWPQALGETEYAVALRHAHPRPCPRASPPQHLADYSSLLPVVVVSSCVSVVVIFSVLPPSSEVWVAVVVFLSSLIAAPYPLPGVEPSRHRPFPIPMRYGTLWFWDTLRRSALSLTNSRSAGDQAVRCND